MNSGSGVPNTPTLLVKTTLGELPSSAMSSNNDTAASKLTRRPRSKSSSDARPGIEAR